MCRGRYYGVMSLAMMLLVVLYLQLPAYAVPSFTRRTGGVSCSMCHWQQNALNATGKEYLRRGVRLAGEQADVTTPEMKLSQYASLALAPALTAVEGDGTRFSAGDAVLWLAGPVDSHFSALAETEFKIDDGEVEVEEIYAHFVTDSGSDYFSARMGQFQPFLFLAQVSGPPRITLSRPAVMSGRATNGNSFRPRSRLRGVEIGTVNAPVSAYLGLGNGPGQNASDNHMDIYATVEREIGTQGSSVGVWGYWGEAVLDGGFRDSFNRYGILGNYTAARARVVGAYLLGDNEDPSGVDLDNNGWFIEIAHKVQPETAAYLRWDQFDADLASGDERQTEGPTLGVSWTPTEVTRITVEAQWLDTDDTSRDSLAAECQIAF